MKNIKSKKYLIIILIALITIATGISFAYLGSILVNTNISIFAQRYSGLNIVVPQDIIISLNANIEQLTEGGENISSSYYGNVHVTPDSNNPSLLCDYNIYFNPVNAFQNSSNNEFDDTEFELVGTNLTDSSKDFTLNLAGVTTKTLLASGLLGSINNGVTVSDYWQFTLKHYSLDFDQSDHKNKTYSGYISYEGTSCREFTNLSDRIMYLTGKTQTASDSSSWAVVNENGYRYEGKNPNNYVSFSGELYRIIGTFDGSTAGLTSGEYYTKLIKADSYPEYATIIDSDSYKLWSSTSLANTYNNEYYNSLSQKNMIANAFWHESNPATAWGIPAGTYYTQERSSSLGSLSKIGLMYISDYAYGPLASDCARNTTVDHYHETEGCYANNWLFSGKQESTISPRSANTIFFITESGYTNATYRYTTEFNRPSFYLQNDVKIASGTGTSSDPYILSFDEGVPSEYAKLEYIESNGKQYIDTGIVAQNGLDVTLYVDEWQRSTNGSDYYFMYTGSSYTNFTGIEGTKDDGAFYIGQNGSSVKITGVAQSYTDTYFRYQISGSTINYVVGGVSGSTTNTGTYPSSNIWLFGRTNSPQNSYARYSQATIYINGTLVRNFVPVYRKSDGKPGMYDLVTRTFFTNQGTGDFEYFDNTNYTQMEYLSSRSTSYIDTGVNTSSITLGLDFKFQFPIYTHDDWFGQNYYSSGDIASYQIGMSSNNIIMMATNTSKSAIITSKSFAYDSSWHTARMNLYGHGSSLDGTVYQEYVGGQTGTSSYNFWLFARNGNITGDNYSGIRMNLAYMKMYDGATILRDYVPCYRNSDGTPGLYDKVTKAFYTGQGSGRLSDLSSSVVSLSGSTFTDSNSDSWGIVNENGYRYEGANPNNYVRFSGGLYRIVGSFEGSTIGLTSGSYYTKLLKVYSITNTNWSGSSSNQSNDWTLSTLNTDILNGTYYNSLTQKDMIVNATWYLGGSSYGQTAAGYYSQERSSTGGAANTSRLTSTGKVGLMYVSDYGYGVLSSSCARTIIVNEYGNTATCYTKNWIYSDFTEFLINPHLNYSYYTWIRWDFGPAGSAYVYKNPHEIRPTFYVKSNTIITGGSGTASDPYTIAAEKAS